MVCNLTTTYKIVILYVVFFLFCSCFNYKKHIDEHSDRDWSSIYVINSFDFFKTDDGQSIPYKDSLNIVYHHDVVLLIFPYSLVTYTMNTPGDKSTGEQKLTSHKIKQKYLIYNIKSKLGKWYDSINAVKPVVVSVDSILRQKALKGFPFFNSTNDTLISSVYSRTGNIFQEKHTYKVKKDDSYCDSIFYYFNNDLKTIPFSYSRDLDSLRNSKVYKIKMIYNPIPKGKYAFPVPERQFNFQFQKVDIPNKNEIYLFIKDFERSYKSESKKN